MNRRSFRATLATFRADMATVGAAFAADHPKVVADAREMVSASINALSYYRTPELTGEEIYVRSEETRAAMALLPALDAAHGMACLRYTLAHQEEARTLARTLASCDRPGIEWSNEEMAEVAKAEGIDLDLTIPGVSGEVWEAYVEITDAEVSA